MDLKTEERLDYGLAICAKARLGWCYDDAVDLANEMNTKCPKWKLAEIYNNIKELHYEEAREVLIKDLFPIIFETI